MFFLLACGAPFSDSSVNRPTVQTPSDAEVVDTASDWIEEDDAANDDPEDAVEEPEEDVCSSEGVWPDPFWPVEPPQNHGFDPALLEVAADYATANKGGISNDIDQMKLDDD